MTILKIYCVIVLVAFEATALYKTYTNMQKEEDFKYDLIAFFIMLPILYLCLAFEV